MADDYCSIGGEPRPVSLGTFQNLSTLNSRASVLDEDKGEDGRNDSGDWGKRHERRARHLHFKTIRIGALARGLHRSHLHKNRSEVSTPIRLDPQELISKQGRQAWALSGSCKALH
jgi:hypothetical protein